MSRGGSTGGSPSPRPGGQTRVLDSTLSSIPLATGFPTRATEVWPAEPSHRRQRRTPGSTCVIWPPMCWRGTAASGMCGRTGTSVGRAQDVEDAGNGVTLATRFEDHGPDAPPHFLLREIGFESAALHPGAVHERIYLDLPTDSYLASRSLRCSRSSPGSCKASARHRPRRVSDRQSRPCRAMDSLDLRGGAEAPGSRAPGQPYIQQRPRGRWRSGEGDRAGPVLAPCRLPRPAGSDSRHLNPAKSQCCGRRSGSPRRIRGQLAAAATRLPKGSARKNLTVSS